MVWIMKPEFLVLDIPVKSGTSCISDGLDVVMNYIFNTVLIFIYEQTLYFLYGCAPAPMLI